jgi:hypothetical protein
MFNRNRIKALEKKVQSLQIENDYYKFLLSENKIDVEEQRYVDVTPKHILVGGELKNIKSMSIGVGNGAAKECSLILDRMTGITKTLLKE